MKKKILKKSIVYGIMLLFIGTCIVPCINGDVTSDEKTIANTPEPYEGPDFLHLIIPPTPQTYQPIRQHNGMVQTGTTLITETYNSRVIEIDMNGTILWELYGLYMPIDADRLGNGNTLIAVLGTQQVIEVNSSGAILWNYTAWGFDADRLANGNTLISDIYSFRVIEVDSSGAIVWQKTNITMPLSVERLPNGNTLIAIWDIFNDTGRVIEVDNTGATQWEYGGVTPWDAKRLENGNTLIADTGGNRSIEVTTNGTIVWEFTGIEASSVQRFDNGNTLIAAGYDNKVIEVDPSGSIVWEKPFLGPFDAERILPVFDVTIKKGLGITATVENIGSVAATNVEVNITVTGGLVLLGRTKTVPLDDLQNLANDTAKSFLIGIGKISIEATVTCDQGVKGYGNATGFLLLFLIL